MGDVKLLLIPMVDGELTEEEHSPAKITPRLTEVLLMLQDGLLSLLSQLVLSRDALFRCHTLLEWLSLYQSLFLTTELVPRAPRSSCRLSRRTSTSDQAASSRTSSSKILFSNSLPPMVISVVKSSLGSSPSPSSFKLIDDSKNPLQLYTSIKNTCYIFYFIMCHLLARTLKSGTELLGKRQFFL